MKERRPARHRWAWFVLLVGLAIGVGYCIWPFSVADKRDDQHACEGAIVEANRVVVRTPGTLDERRYGVDVVDPSRSNWPVVSGDPTCLHEARRRLQVAIAIAFVTVVAAVAMGYLGPT